jgi:hypothetical protein
MRVCCLEFVFISIFLFAACSDDTASTPLSDARLSPDQRTLDLKVDHAIHAETGKDLVLDAAPPLDNGADVLSDITYPDRTLYPTDGGLDVDPRPWQMEVVDNSPHFKSRAAVAASLSGDPQVAYNIATSTDGWGKPAVWFAHQGSGSWDKSLAVDAAGISREFPVTLVDAKGRSYIFYNQYIASNDQVDIFYTYSYDQQTFVAPINLTASAQAHEFAPSVALDDQGNFHLLFQRVINGAYSIGYLKLTNGQASPVETVADAVTQFSLSPDYAVGVDRQLGIVYAVYCRSGDLSINNVLYLRQRTNSWQPEQRVTDKKLDVWSPSVAVDGNGQVHLVYNLGPDWDHKTLTYNRLLAGSLLGEQALTTSTDDRSYYLGLAAESDGTVHIAFARYYTVVAGGNGMGDILYLKGKNGVFFPEERVTNTPTLDEDYTGIALGAGGKIYISLVENGAKAPDGVVYLATKK